MARRSLKQDVAEINGLLESLEEESISRLTLDDGSVSVTLHSPDKGAIPITLLYEDPTCYPKSAALMLSDVELPFLEALADKLAAGGRLTKALRLLGSKLGMELDWVEEADGDGGGGGSDEDDEMVEAYGGEHSDEEDAELLREWSKCLTRWEIVEREAERQDEDEEEKSGWPAANLDALSNKQIFDTKAAFRRLVNEMEEIFKAQDFNLVAEATGPEGLYTWTVSLAGFSPDSPLAQDMQQAGRKFGVSSVQLQLHFKRGLHPFYPPSVKLMAPRFQGPVLGALASHPLVSAERWDPFQSAKELLLSIKAFLEENGRVDLDAERNRMSGPGASAYLEAEHLLARLEALSGVPSIWRCEGHPLYSVHAAPADKDKGAGDSPRPASKKQKAELAVGAGPAPGEAGSKIAWKKGVGYGYGSKQSEVWDAKRALAVQMAHDAELQDVLARLAKTLSAQLGGGGADLADCVQAVRQSCLAPLVVHQLCNTSLQDMAARHGYYHALLECLDAVCCPATALLLSWRAAPGELGVAEALGRVQTQASHFVRVCATAGAASPIVGRRINPPSAGAGDGAGPSTSSAVGRGDKEEEERELALANYILAVAKRAEALAAAHASAAAAGPSTSAAAAAAAVGGGGGRTRGQRAAAAAAAAAEPAPDADAQYRIAMSAHKVRLVPGISGTHSYADNALKESVQPKERLRRVARELASCESDLPVHPDSSVFVVADEASSCLWKALITGPKDTPYEGGMFIFDIYFPSDYPRTAPKVLLRTTGGGSVRFNPNLYNCGKVCLSLLGTWQGGRGESWDSSLSTILQVLVSIQSLILVDEPFYNEPGYEQRANSAQSDAYSANIMEQTVRWGMVDQLKSPPPYFKEVIESHFRLRGEAILANVRRWAQWCREKKHPGHGSAIDKLAGELEGQIHKLTAS